MKQALKRWWFRLRGKNPEAVIVSFRTGDAALADAMCAEVRSLEPSRTHLTVSPDESWDDVRRKLRPYRIGLAPVLFTGEAQYAAMRRRVLRLAPSKILAYNGRLERHHLKPTAPVSAVLFLRGVPLDRIFLRPWWLWPFRRDKTLRPSEDKVVEGRPCNPHRKTIGVLTPYFPYPLSHGGAVRIFNLLREIAREFNVVLYAFTEAPVSGDDMAPVLDFISRVCLVEKPRYREPRWSTIQPPEVREYVSPAMSRLIAARAVDLLQTEYTFLASYGGDILVEHDVTFDLYAQILARQQTRSAWWDWWRWQRYETGAVTKFPRVVVMSEKDRKMLGASNACVIENGVDIRRFQPEPETLGRQLLFIGSFRHFPNIVAFRFLTEEILPLVGNCELTVVAGPEPWLHWRNHTGTVCPPSDPRIKMLEFVADVRPLYHHTNVVVVPTLESAGTNVKVLEAMAMQRAVVSTSSGAAGLGLEHGENIWISDDASGFAAAIEKLLDDEVLRSRIARTGRLKVEQHFDWRAIGLRHRALLRELLGDRLTIRPATQIDLEQIIEIQVAAPEASQWDAASYLEFDSLIVAEESRVLGFVVSRQIAPGEREILNLAVCTDARGRGIGRRLMEFELARCRGTWFLEVRQSNLPAIQLYESLGFDRTGLRERYYNNPAEPGIVMRLFS